MIPVYLRFVSPEGRDLFSGRSIAVDIPEVPALGHCLRLSQPGLSTQFALVLSGRTADFLIKEVRWIRQVALADTLENQAPSWWWQIEVFLTANMEAAPQEAPPAVPEALEEVQMEINQLLRSERVEREMASEMPSGAARMRRLGMADQVARTRRALETLLALVGRGP